jgi:pimeloyl-ACP methyl ester carboxylesterase
VVEPPATQPAGRFRLRVPRRPGLVAGIVVVVLVLLALLATAALSWVFSSKLLDPDHSLGPFGIGVERLEVRDRAGARSAAFERTEDSARRGVYGLDFEDGHAVAGRVVGGTGGEVTRRVSDIRGDLDEGTKVAFDDIVWHTNPLAARGIPYREVHFSSQLGAMPAWRVAGRGRTWAIFVHGHNVTRAEGLRVLGPLHRARLPSLLIAYRNDPGAPPAKDGLLHLGATEWRDLESAVRYAIRRGARSFVILGDSMGGAIVSQFVHESPLAERVRALVLDAPVLDWKAVLDLQADERGLPRFLATTTEWTVSRRIEFDWDAFDQIARAKEFRMPILLFHGTEDTTVPIATSDAFARALPRLVTYYRVAGAGHVESWNVDPPLYDRRVGRFLARIR